MTRWVGQEPRSNGRVEGEDAVSTGDPLAPYEPALRTVILGASRDAGTTPFDIVDVTDLPWIEIDFPEDLERARERIVERLGAR